MQTKKTALVIVLAIMTLSLTSCDREKVLSTSEIPAEITEYASTHFPNNAILQVVEDVDGLSKTYNVILKDNISLEFNRKKEIKDIDGTTKLPESVIPLEIARYVTANFPNNLITDWELEDKHQQVGLDNGLDLEFTLKGDFIRIDD